MIPEFRGRGQGKELECQGGNEPLWLVIETFIFFPIKQKTSENSCSSDGSGTCLVSPQGGASEPE